ncbi:MAG: protease family protein [Thermoanaerobaculia bacterium]|jgi:membrane protease YdiL (CAAX protease family)|nr:protease family protein [Thermoanaerobaculia bacterium]
MIRALIPYYVNALGVMLLVFAGVLLPILIVKSARRLGTGPLPISRARFYKQTIIFQLILAAISAWTAYTHGILAMPLPQRPLTSWSAAALMYVVMVLTLKLRWASRSAASKQRLYDILPHNSAELMPYVFICIAAGTCEELVYRGVMTEVAQRLIGIAVVTVIAMSISFAAAHAMQGLRSMIGIFAIALACHALVWLAQSLIPVMVVHFAYDLTAGMLIPRWFEAAA